MSSKYGLLGALDTINTFEFLQGDSGGPVQIRSTHQDGFIYHIVGVTSFGILCGTTAPGVYTRVSSFIEWIENEVWLN